MQRLTWLGVGTVLVSALCGCSGDDPAPGSTISHPKGGSGGTGGEAGSLSLGISGGGAAGGGTGGMSGAGGASSGSGGVEHAGTSAGGAVSHSGSSSGGSGGSKPAGMCKRAASGDADCADFYPAEPPDPARPQAYACDDTGAFRTLNAAHGSKCASVNFVPGSKYGACCPP